MNAKTLGKTAVLLGGNSAEREISLMSGQAVLAALQAGGVDAYPFDPAVQPLWALKQEGFARAFIALHGRFGEDGTVQGALEAMGIPYTGSGVMASAVAMDKWRTKLLWQAAGVPTPDYRLLEPQTDPLRVMQALGLPLIIKPAREGSSIGVTKVGSASDFAPAQGLAQSLDPLVIAESFIAGREFTAAVLGETALPLVEIVAPGGQYDYQHKYFTDDVRYQCPADLAPALADEIRAAALRAFRVLGCRGWARADLLVQPDGRYFFLEMNTAPGMTGHSLVPIAARAAGLSFEALCLRILELASLG